MKIERQGMVCDTSKRPVAERAAFFTGLCLLSSGSIICSFQIGRKKMAPESTIKIFRSRDQGKTWQELLFCFETCVDGVPGSLATGEIVEVEAGRLLMIATWFDRRDPTLPLFDPVTEGILPSKQLAAYSIDEGNSWTAWREIPIPTLKGCSCTGPILKWSDGAIAYCFESYKEFDDPSPGCHAAWFMVSRDQGSTFSEPVQVAKHPNNLVYFWDQRLCAGKAPGEFIALFWTHDLEHKKDLNVHMRKFSPLSRSFLSQPVASTRIPGQIAAPLLLDDGRLLAFVVDRNKPCTMTLWASTDGGSTWPEKIVVHLHDEQASLSQGKENIDFAQYWDDMSKWSFGHPAIRSLGNGKVFVAYYAGGPDCLSIHWARVRV